MTIATTKPQVTQIARIKALRDRLIKAEELVREGKVHPVIDMPDHWVVEGTNRHYLVNNSCFALTSSTALICWRGTANIAWLLCSTLRSTSNLSPQAKRSWSGTSQTCIDRP